MKVLTQQKSDVARELKRGEKEKHGNRVACRKLARRWHQDDGNQQKERWRDASFLPPAIPSPSRSLAPTPPLCRHAQPAREVFVRHLLLRAAPISFWHKHKFVYLRVPDFPNHSFMKKPSKSLYSPAIVDKSIIETSTPQLQSDKSILNPSSPSKESYPCSAQEGSGGQVRPPVELQEPAVLQSLVFLPPLELQSSILRSSVVVLQEQGC